MEGARILLVDDDPALLVAMTSALRLRLPEVIVETAESGAVACQRAAAADYDAIVTDIKMPGLDGLSVLQEIRGTCPDVPTLLITGHGQHDLAVQALRGGAFDFIQKPVDRDYFVASLSRAIQVRQLRRQVEFQQRALADHAAELEESVLARTRELREANQAKDDFLATLAHELRNPLASVRSALELVNRCPPDDPERDEALEVASRQVSHMTRLLDDLLDVSRIVRQRVVLRKQRVDLGTVIASAVRSIRPALEEGGHQFACRVPDEPLPVEGDPTRLEQIVLNLLWNAIKYTDRAGRIGLTVERREQDVVIVVEDNGIGIAADMLTRIFEPFAQADRSLDRSRGGLGIGLTLVKSLVELHGGSVHAVSAGEGRGSTFSVRLPLLAGLAAPAPVDRRAAAAADATGWRIVLVDDNATVARMLGLLLRNCGHDVVAVAHDGQAALSAVEQHAPDVVLLDIGLPGMSGYDVARELRRRPKFQDLMLVAMTGYGQESDRQRSHAAGFDHHLVKPVSIDTLQELLSKAPQRVAAERDATSPSHAGPSGPSAGAGTCVGIQVVPWTRS